MKLDFLKKIFSYKVVDEHIKLCVLGVRANIRQKVKIQTPKITQSGVSGLQKTKRVPPPLPLP